MSQGLFRRNEIWFTKLNSNQMTEVYPLTDFKPLKGSSNERLDVKNLNGKNGALPYVDLSLIENVLNDRIDDNLGPYLKLEKYNVIKVERSCRYTCTLKMCLRISKLANH